ncbi:scaffold protein [Caulobacter phage Percy]|uniref:Scaffold protein n=1 Tax=Caulobacter phage Percy TaxID=1701809 RepID=A0A0M4RBV4_9CAUD|nr:head scaffolding protein [Caulobacter phage Percy]ALF01672.1 scaffold protein [Caulobacter phage Percy]
MVDTPNDDTTGAVTPEVALQIESTPAPIADPIAAAAAAAAAEAAKAGEQNPVPEKPIKEDPPEPSYTYEPTGDPGLDTALQFIGALGINEHNPAMQAAIKGDFTALRALCASMGDKAKGYENFVALGERAYKDAKAEADRTATAKQAAILEAAGDEDTWKAVLAWAGTVAEPHEKTRLNAMLEGDEFQARAAANLLVSQYNKRVNAPLKPAAKHDASGEKAGKEVPATITRREFASEVRALAFKHGDNYNTTPEYKQLVQRLNAGQR